MFTPNIRVSCSSCAEDLFADSSAEGVLWHHDPNSPCMFRRSTERPNTEDILTLTFPPAPLVVEFWGYFAPSSNQEILYLGGFQALDSLTHVFRKVPDLLVGRYSIPTWALDTHFWVNFDWYNYPKTRETFQILTSEGSSEEWISIPDRLSQGRF
jgi:hypothetical protein